MDDSITKTTIYPNEAQEWTLNLLQSLTLVNACNRIMMLLEKPEENGLAFRMLHLGVITVEEVGEMIETLCPAMTGEPIEMYDEDILVLYTIIELYVRVMLTETGDEIRASQVKYQEKMPESMRFDMDAVFKTEMGGISALIRQIMDAYEDHPAFMERREQLQKLNDYI